ncbi:MAG: hypothetical protein RI907_3735 [Pseudomonadota bacterium]|jgi:AcrR family transcriptional regulator
MPADTKPGHRTQRERREETIGQLVDATIGCLVELGYTHTTTQAVAAKAGLSQGAIFRHFATRQDLLIAAAQALSVRFLDDYRERLAQASATAAPDQRVDVAVQALSEVICSPNQVAWFELQLAARTDQALCAAFQPIYQRCMAESVALGQELLPDVLGQLPVANEVIQLIIHIFHGMTLAAHVEPGPARQGQMLAVTTMIAKAALAALRPGA